jgi:hypothetical protein
VVLMNGDGVWLLGNCCKPCLGSLNNVQDVHNGHNDQQYAGDDTS